MAPPVAALRIECRGASPLEFTGRLLVALAGSTAKSDMSMVATQSHVPQLVDASDLGIPLWAIRLLERAEASRSTATVTGELTAWTSASVSLISVRKSNASTLSPEAFEACTRNAYKEIASALAVVDACHPVRFWNYIPDIHRPCGTRLDRYMCFNAGRFSACSEWLGGPEMFGRLLATGSGIGHRGTDLVIYALAAATPGTAVENPRQTPAYRYSSRFGPRPPCFARATILRLPGERPLVLVGGTASIRGEESVHQGDLRGQTLETFENLASLVCSASGTLHKDALATFRELRVYHVLDSDRAAIEELIRQTLPGLDRVEYIRADLCRRELAVEVEGIAVLE